MGDCQQNKKIDGPFFFSSSPQPFLTVCTHTPHFRRLKWTERSMYHSLPAITAIRSRSCLRSGRRVLSSKAIVNSVRSDSQSDWTNGLASSILSHLIWQSFIYFLFFSPAVVHHFFSSRIDTIPHTHCSFVPAVSFVTLANTSIAFRLDADRQSRPAESGHGGAAIDPAIV